MKKTNLIFLSLLVLAIGFSIYQYYTRPKIAYIRSLEVVYSYNGMQQAHAEYKSQTDEWQSNVDTLKRLYTNAVENYKREESKYSDKEKKEKLEDIRRLEDNLAKYTTAVTKEAQDKDKKLTEAVLNQINGFVESYAKKKGYDLVLAAQGNGSVLYGNKAMDITSEVIEAMNKEYKMIPADNTDQPTK